jgi:hypothetical protein
MTEDEWLASNDLRRMLRCLCEQFRWNDDRNGQRKMRLFACALARTVWDLVPAGSCQEAVAACEQFADGDIPEEQIQDHPLALLREWDQVLENHWYNLSKLRSAIGGNQWGKNAALLSQAANEVCEVETAILKDGGASAQVRKQLDANLKQRHLARFRDLFGNPFRPVTLQSFSQPSNFGVLARTIYDDRRLPSGLFDNQSLAVLADALEEAGCDNADILDHCRKPGEHVRGCWVVDLILGKR